MLQSKVKGHEGDCVYTWMNRNLVTNRLDGGISGYFRNTKEIFFGLFTIKTGKEFHGIVKWNALTIVEDTRTWGFE
jgi:hypothetical protein